MGGILAQMQVIDSGDDFRRAYFNRPIDQLKLSNEIRPRVRASLEFSRVPWIRRVVFVATPHWGSQLADAAIVRFMLFLIRVPIATAQLVTEMTEFNFDAINPELHGFGTLGVRSVQNLSPRHPYFRALNARPIGIPFNSIIGDRGRGDTPYSSDGVVPYWSSHLEGAQSEKIVPAPHNLTEKTETIKEIQRILRDHLSSIDSQRQSRANRCDQDGRPRGADNQ